MEQRNSNNQLKPRIVVVGLGPGNPDLVTAETLRFIKEIPVRFLRTSQHPSADLVGEATSFDFFYDSAPAFDDVYQNIVRALVEAAILHTEILYAVPGSPTVLERTVAYLRNEADVDVVVCSAISFLDETWRVLNIDPVEEGVRLIDGHEFATAAAGHTGALLVAHTHANWVISNIKLSIDDPDPDTSVVVLHHIGLVDQEVIHTTWSQMDQCVEADHLTSLFVPNMSHSVGQDLVRFHELSRTLRAQCPWDMEQTHHSLVRYLIEETYEVVDAIGRLDMNDPSTDDDLIEELGDLLYQVEFHAAIAEQQGRFTMGDVARTVHDKLVARHPHVFGNVTVGSAAEVESNWEEIKKAEKSHRVGIFDGVVDGSPALLLASKVQQRAARVGFDWADVAGPMEKVSEEVQEVATAIVTNDPEATMMEIGDLLFAVVNVARHLDVDPESALRSAVLKFRRRVDGVEQLAAIDKRTMSTLSLKELDELWEQVKSTESL